ncbi:MAG: glycosyltransferase family 2 protein [Candidatus Aenigmarchaeota archaeon]|nr:glycosyltransferase family 2 protein [Candidatus Aenigmarchaeota archaeon]
MKYDLSVVIPFYNEEDNVKDVILLHSNLLKKHKINYEIIAINNGSRDKTGEILDKLRNDRVKVVTVHKNIGYGNGLLQGLKHAKGEVVGWTGGDNEIPATALLSVYKKLIKENLDICKVTRTAREYNFYRKFVSASYNYFVCPLIFGGISRDINGYPKLMKRGCYESLKLRALDSFIDTELLVKARKKNFKVGEVQSIYSKRKKGKSNVKFYIVLEFIKNIILFKLTKKFDN